MISVRRESQMMRSLVMCALAASVVSCASGAGGGSGGASQGSPRAQGSLRSRDRVVIPSMIAVTGLAMSDRYVFVATPNALAVYDARFNEWLPPLSRMDGWPDVPVDVMMADPADPTALWFAAGTFVYHYRAGFDDLTRAIVPSRVSPNAFYADGGDPGAGVIVAGGPTGAVRVSPTGFVQPYSPAPGRPPGARITPQTPASVFAKYRSLQDFQRMLTRDDALRTWPISAAASNPIKSEVWLGTLGGGVFKVDPTFARSEQVPFGLLGQGARSVARAADGVWFGSFAGANSGREGLTFVDTDLRRWRWIDGGPGSPLVNARITAITPWESKLWVASDRGVVLLDGQSGNMIRRWDDLSGLPNALSLAIAPTPSGAWVGTARGLVFAHAPDAASRGTTTDADSLVLSDAVRALTTRGDTLWIGSERGLLVLVPGAREPRRIGASSDMRLSLPVTAIATADSLVVFATSNDEVLSVHARTGASGDVVAFAEATRAGRVNALAMDASTIWIAGDRGVVVVRRDTRAQRVLVPGRDIPADAFGIALTPQYAWIATREGGVRVTRLADGMVR
jgi:hypothetical protein